MFNKGAFVGKKKVWKYYWYYASKLNPAAIVNKDGEIIINSIKIIKTIYKFHYKINVVAEPPEVA
jgi:hypothetical protein